MPFFWKCPCGDQNYYKGKKTTDAVTTCSSCSLKSRIFRYKIVVSIPPKTTPKNTDALDSMVHALYPMVKDVSLGRDLNKSTIIEGLNNTIRIYRNSKITREGSRITKRKPGEGKKVLEWVERHENQQSVPLLVVHHPYFQKVLLAYQELEKLR